MTLHRAAAYFALILTFAVFARQAHAQALPTATRTQELSVFGGATGTFTGLDRGKNLGITAGVDYSFYSYRGYHPAIEVRGTYPIHDGQIDALKSFLGGIRIEHRVRRLRPYVDGLAGRGEIDYEGGGYTPVNSPFTFISSTSTIYSIGGGSDLDLTDHFALRADYQYQFWASPILASGEQHPSVLTAAIVYRFASIHPKHHYDRAPMRVAPPPPPPATPPSQSPNP